MEKGLLTMHSLKDMLGDFTPEIALILGSGLGGYAERIRAVKRINYSDIEGFPVSRVEGHRGRFIFGYLGDKRVVAMQGRVHYYEGYAMKEVVKPVYFMRDMGAEKLIITNAAGAVNTEYEAGDLMLMTDHILAVPNPLIGEYDARYARFPDMSAVYDAEYMEIAENIAGTGEIDIKRGVYVQLSGPSYETPAEVRMWRALGADAVGMSSACEAVAARHCGMRVLGISCITNAAAGSGKTLSHEEVIETADMAASKLEWVLNGVIGKI